MGRKAREESETGLYHTIVRGNNKAKLFHEPSDFDTWLSLLDRFFLKYPLKLHHYCLMSNHVHQLVHAPGHSDLSCFMHGLLRSYFHYFRRKYRYTGHLFQGRFKSLAIGDETYLLECGRYVEQNPVRAGMVQHPGDWFYSSYLTYAHGKPDARITPSDAYQALDGSRERRQALYRDYVNQLRVYEGASHFRR